MAPHGRPARTASVLTHGSPDRASRALRLLLRVAREEGVELWFDAEETEKHGVEPSEGVLVGRPWRSDADLCVVLGGDGTILRGLRRHLWTGVPVYAINLGEIGFLATVEPEEQEEGLRRAFAGNFEVLGLPALEVTLEDGRRYSAINDVSVNRRTGDRVASLRYRIAGEDVGHVRCDGLVLATPAGSTGYNLANGGPVLAWGVEGYAVSFIAPHTLSARVLVVAPDDELALDNDSTSPVEISVDGRPRGHLDPDTALRVHYRRDAGLLAQTAGTSFYRRLREKFGKLAG
ncbi:NAD(+)/NADH kinase [Patulibacter sp. SYSU D01012]|uniref:NAD(+)/NADH kinase n=1 Tax=Patulibacter sp. SYSU D01012 TaxID=2817381 RepID=UPI001B3135CA|nr:NAD(+)/NADH kinase [Patulibacter sp. SYSU D01012]